MISRPFSDFAASLIQHGIRHSIEIIFITNRYILFTYLLTDVVCLQRNSRLRSTAMSDGRRTPYTPLHRRSVPSLFRDDEPVKVLPSFHYTSCTPGSAPGPALGNEYGKTLTFCRVVVI